MTPIRPSEILDPNSERVRSLGGVRQTISPVQAPDLRGPQVQAAATHTTFVASLPTRQRQRHKWRLPIASTALHVLGQGALGASIASGTVDPAVGAAAAVGSMVCGLALIAAQCISIAGQDPARAEGSIEAVGSAAVGIGRAVDAERISARAIPDEAPEMNDDMNFGPQTELRRRGPGVDEISETFACTNTRPPAPTLWSEVAQRTERRRERSGSRSDGSGANAATGLSLCHNGRTNE